MDNAATTAVRKEVAEAMLPYLLGDYGNPSGVYRLSEKAKNVVEESRDIIADIINRGGTFIYHFSLYLLKYLFIKMIVNAPTP